MEKALSRQQMELIASTFLFQGVDELVAEQMVLDQRSRLEAYQKGQVIFDKIHFSRALGILLSGEILVKKPTAGGNAITMGRLGPGKCFGATAMFHQRDQYPMILTATKQTLILYLPQELLAWAMRRDPEITENYIGYLSDQIWSLHAKISVLTAGTAEQKLALFLLDDRASTSITDIGRQLDLGRASVYRALEALESKGWIQKNGKTIAVLEEKKLRAMTDQETPYISGSDL